MKDILFHLPNEGLEGVGSFILGFSYAHINTAFCFYMDNSLQVVSCNPSHYFGAVDIR